jgi:hypothetical protein
MTWNFRLLNFRLLNFNVAEHDLTHILSRTKIFGNRWKALNPWKFSIHAPRALLEGLRAFVGYLL